MLTGWLAAVSLSGAIVLAGRPRPAARLTAAGTGAGHTAMIAAAIVGTALVAVNVSPVLVGVAVVCGLVARRGLASRRRTRERERAATATVEVTFALAAELRAGRTPAQALAAVGDLAGPLRPALQAAHRAVVVGADPTAELARAAVTLAGAEQLAYVAAAWRVAESAGGRVAVVLERLSESMDSEAELRQELDAAMAGPRATMALLAGLPLLGIVLGQSVGAHPLDLLLHHPLGWGLLASAVVLDATGVVVTRAIAVRALHA